MDREAWRAAIHRVTKSLTRQSDWTELTDMNTQETTEQSFEHWDKTTVSIISEYSPSSVRSMKISTKDKHPRRSYTVAQAIKMLVKILKY